MAKPKTDAVATMGLDLEDFEKALSRVVNQELKRLNIAAEKTSKSLKGIEGSSKTAAKALDGFRSVMGALGVSFSLAGILAFGKSLIGFGTDLSDTATISGETAESLQKTTYALSMMGVSSEDSRQAIHTLAVTLQEARDGNVEATQKLEDLGVTAAQIKDPLTTASTLLSTIADHAKEAGMSQEEARRFTEAFGHDLGAKLLPALQGGSKALKYFGDQAPIVSDKMAKAAKAADETLARWSTSIKVWAVDAIEWIMKVSDAHDAAEKKKHNQYWFGNQKAEAEEDAFLAKRGQEHNSVVPKELGGEGKAKETEQVSTFEKVADQFDKVNESTKDAGESIAKILDTEEGVYSTARDIEDEWSDVNDTVIDVYKSQKDLLDAEEKLARTIAPERIKQQQHLVNEHDRLLDTLNQELQKGAQHNVLKEKELRLQLALNEQQQRAILLQQYLLTPQGRAAEHREENRQQRLERKAQRDINKVQEAQRTGGSYRSSIYRQRDISAAKYNTVNANTINTKTIKVAVQ